MIHGSQAPSSFHLFQFGLLKRAIAQGRARQLARDGTRKCAQERKRDVDMVLFFF